MFVARANYAEKIARRINRESKGKMSNKKAKESLLFVRQSEIDGKREALSSPLDPKGIFLYYVPRVYFVIAVVHSRDMTQICTLVETIIISLRKRWGRILDFSSLEFASAGQSFLLTGLH